MQRGQAPAGDMIFQRQGGDTMRALVTTALLLGILLGLACTGGCGRRPAPQGVDAGKGQPASATPGAKIFCRIDGRDWEATEASSFAERGVNDKGEKALFLKLVRVLDNGRQEKINFSVPFDGKPGVIALTGDNSQYIMSTPMTLFCKEGKLTIKEIDAERVSGAFSFIAASHDDKTTAELTDGRFVLKF